RMGVAASPTHRRNWWWCERLDQRPEERDDTRPARGPGPGGGVPARQAGQGRCLRPHEAQERAQRRRHRAHLPRRREARAGHRRPHRPGRHPLMQTHNPGLHRRPARKRTLELVSEDEAKQVTPADVIASLPLPPETYTADVVAGVGQHLADLDEVITRYAAPE